MMSTCTRSAVAMRPSSRSKLAKSAARMLGLMRVVTRSAYRRAPDGTEPALGRRISAEVAESEVAESEVGGRSRSGGSAHQGDEHRVGAVPVRPELRGAAVAGEVERMPRQRL